MWRGRVEKRRPRKKIKNIELTKSSEFTKIKTIKRNVGMLFIKLIAEGAMHLIGQTKRQLSTRVKEYKYNIRLDPSKYSWSLNTFCKPITRLIGIMPKFWIQSTNITKDLYLK